MKPKKSTKTVRKVTDQQKLRRILNKIDTVLSASYNDDSAVAAKLWDVLSALRGPDSELGNWHKIKDATTSVLRKIAFPKTFATLSGSIVMNEKATGASDSVARAALRSAITSLEESTGVHFTGHIDKGFTALGLDWYTENK